MIEPLRLSFEVAAPPEHAFETWTDAIDHWWPADHTAHRRDQPDDRAGGPGRRSDLRAHDRRQE